MDNQQQQPSNYYPNYHGILPINQYPPPLEQPQTTELPLEEIQEVLEDSSRSRRQDVLIMAINYLQDRCTYLTHSNNYLFLRLQDLTEEISFLEQLQIDQQVALNFLSIIQNQVVEYRQEFKQYRNLYSSTNKKLLQQNTELKGKIQQLQLTLQKHQQQFQYAQEENNSLSAINQQLNQKIDFLQDQLNSKMSQPKRYFSRRLENQIQAELEAMIEQLMHEVQNERNQKYKLSTELKRIQSELINLERQLQQKDKYIYQLKIQHLKNNRLSPKPKANPKLRQTYHKDYTAKQFKNGLTRERQHETIKQFSLVQLYGSNNEAFDKKTRLIIASKLIEFFKRKIKKNQIGQYSLQSLLVYNYSSFYPQTCIIRKDRSQLLQSSCNTSTFIYNIADMLHKILLVNQTQPRQTAQIQLFTFINSILQEDSCQLNDVDALMMLVQQAIKLCK